MFNVSPERLNASARETADAVSDVQKPESQAVRGALGAQQYHEQNDAEDGDKSHYDRSHRLSGTLPTADEHFPG